jgi:hypothetical protein
LPELQPNVIVLTSGLTGSSVLTGLVARAGYWTGRTHKKEYDTFENQELIHANRHIVEAAGYCGNYLTEFSPQAIRQVSDSYKHVDLTPYREFVAKCNQHRPWVWKDPRLWLTIRFWLPLLDPSRSRFLILTRDIKQTWLSTTLRRQIRPFCEFKRYEEAIARSAEDFCKENSLRYLHCRYDRLIGEPNLAIDELNRFLSTNLTVEDLQMIYTKPLFRSPRASLADQLKAYLIYMKNYHERVRSLP